MQETNVCYYCNQPHVAAEPSNLPPWIRDLTLEHCTEIFHLAMVQSLEDKEPLTVILSKATIWDYKDVEFDKLTITQLRLLLNHAGSKLVKFVKHAELSPYALIKRLPWLSASLYRFKTIRSWSPSKNSPYADAEITRSLARTLEDLGYAYIENLCASVNPAITNSAQIRNVLENSIPIDQNGQTWLCCSVNRKSGQIDQYQISSSPAYCLRPQRSHLQCLLKWSRKAHSRIKARWIRPKEGFPSGFLSNVLRLTRFYLRMSTQWEWLSSDRLSAFGNRTVEEVQARLLSFSVRKLGCSLGTQIFPVHLILENYVGPTDVPLLHAARVSLAGQETTSSDRLVGHAIASCGEDEGSSEPLNPNRVEPTDCEELTLDADD